MITYENDKDLSELIYTEITDEKLLNFFFKKGGKVNVTNLQWCLNLHAKKEIAQNMVNLETAGLIKYVEHPYAKVTNKARRERIYKSSAWMFWLVTLGVLLTLLGLLLSLR